MPLFAAVRASARRAARVLPAALAVAAGLALAGGGLAAPLSPAPMPGQDDSIALGREIAGLRVEFTALRVAFDRRQEVAEGHQRALKAELGALEERLAALAAAPVLSAAFLAGPPLPSDSLGVAKAMVFAPRLVVDTVRRHDTLFLKLRRLEPGGARLVAELELAGGETSLELPVDQNGALYALEWSTSEGFSYTLTLRDGASQQAAASVEVRALQNQGRFLYVAARLE